MLRLEEPDGKPTFKEQIRTARPRYPVKKTIRFTREEEKRTLVIGEIENLHDTALLRYLFQLGLKAAEELALPGKSSNQNSVRP